MARSTPLVSDGVLTDADGAPGRAVSVGGADWQRWLDDAGTASFRFVHEAGAFTARKERRKGGDCYWYAYRRQGGRLRKGYLGRSADLTPPRLAAMAARLAGDGPPSGPESVDRAERPEDVAPVAAPDRAPEPGPAEATEPLLATKLYLPPPRPGLVRRPRLTARLDAGLRGPLTLLVAPAGFGKTTLLADWRAATSEDSDTARWPVAWLALDAADDDLARFLRYVVAALQTLRPDLGRAALAGLRAPQPPPVEALVTPLLNDLAALPGDVVLVLDDYHVIADPAIHRALAFLLDHLPPRVHLVIASRAEPPLPLARLRARGQLAELRAAELRCTAEEAAAFLTGTMGVPLADADAARLEARTEGWLAGLQLAALALRGHDPAQLPDAVAALAGTHRYLRGYLADEVFARQPADVRRFLLHTAVLDRLRGDLCDAVAGEDDPDCAAGDGQAMLERLEAASLFLVPLDDTRTWYRYHHLFADFLRERLRREASDLAPELHRRACRWHERAGLLADAADHALAAGEGSWAASLVERLSPALLWQRGELATLLRWLERLPPEAVRARPRLGLDLAWALLLGTRVDAVEPRLRGAEAALAAGAAPPPADRALRGEIAALRAELARLRGDAAAAVALAREALAKLPADDRRARGGASAFLGSAYLSAGDAAAATRAYGEATALSRAAGSVAVALFAGGRLILALARQGRLRQAAATYRETLDLADAHGLAATPALGAAEVAMAEVLREWNDLDAAEDLARRGIEHCRAANGMAQMALEGALTLARGLQARGDRDGALATLAGAEAHGRDHRVAQAAERVAVARARLWLTAAPEDIAAVGRWAEARAAAWGAGGPDDDYLGVLERLALARLYLARGRRGEMAALLPALLARTEAGGLTDCTIEALALAARLALERDGAAPALLALGRALALAEPEGFVRAFLDEGAPMVALLRLARSRGVATKYVAALLAACGDEPEATPTAAAALIEPLSARERELLGLLAAGLGTREIAAQLFISPGTVRNHLKSIYGKLGAHSRLQAVERARALGLL
ncbi:MAG TPA: LuxR C-terminal-related transcriptional regulator [Thermomicrobiales bacterium]|nr:LuxR C-terminal-related transcriptional regulator [Thermomicrobiales bacterium]